MSDPFRGSLSVGGLSVRLRISPEMRDVFTRVMQQVRAAQTASPDFPPPPSPRPGERPDPDLHSAWAEGLRETDAGDSRIFSELLAHPKFGVEKIGLSTPAAEAVIRASAQARLRLRETVLRDLSSDEAEGATDPFDLSPAEQQGYACFRLLAHLEEDLLVQLDPDLLKG